MRQNTVRDPPCFLRCGIFVFARLNFQRLDGGLRLCRRKKRRHRLRGSMPSASLSSDSTQRRMAARLRKLCEELNRVFAAGVNIVPIVDERFPDARGGSRRSTD